MIERFAFSERKHRFQAVQKYAFQPMQVNRHGYFEENVSGCISSGLINF